MSDYSSDNVFQEGDRVELSPACDLWMRGAKFGTVVSVYRKQAPRIYYLKMDNPRVKREVRSTADLIRKVG